MKYLLDTHTATWYFTDDGNLSANAKMIIDNDDTALYVSVASVWEIAIKVSTGRANFSLDVNVDSFTQELKNNNIELVSIHPKHLKIVENLPFRHKDPFDRLLVATAIAENMTLITADEKIGKYDCAILW